MSEYTSETTSDSSYSDSEGSYTLTTTSDSGDEDAVETADGNDKTAHQNRSLVSPEPAGFLINPSNTGTYKIKTKGGSIALHNGGLTRTRLHLSPQTGGCKTIAARTWRPSTSSEESKAAKAGAQFLAFRRLRRLPVIRCVASAYNGAKASKCLGWAIALGEAAARMAVAPVSAVASPFASMCCVPINCVDRTLCKGLDIAEGPFPCVVMHPCKNAGE